MVVSSKEIMKLANMALSNPDNTITNTIILITVLLFNLNKLFFLAIVVILYKKKIN